MNIPEEAIEAAAVALWTPDEPEGEYEPARTWESEDESYKELMRAHARRILAAAMPHIPRAPRLVSDEAIEAAVRVFAVNHHLEDALEAAAPYLMAQAWNEGAVSDIELGDDPWSALDANNPYRRNA